MSPWHQKQALFLTWKRASDPRLPTVGASFRFHQSLLPLFAIRLWHRSFLRVSPKSFSWGCILLATLLHLEIFGASSFVCVLSRFLVVFVWLVSTLVLVALCTFLHNLLMLNICLEVADTASLTPLFSSLKGAPPLTNPSSYLQKKQLHPICFNRVC